jgi:hypothetical protein
MGDQEHLFDFCLRSYRCHNTRDTMVENKYENCVSEDSSNVLQDLGSINDWSCIHTICAQIVDGGSIQENDCNEPHDSCNDLKDL